MPNNLEVCAIIKHTIIATNVGKIAEIRVHFMLPVSFLIVHMVVPQGKCRSENSIKLMAVIKFQPWLISIFFKASRFSKSTIEPADK